MDKKICFICVAILVMILICMWMPHSISKALGETYINPSPKRDRGNGLETRPGIEPSRRGDVTPNLPALTGTLAIQGGEEVSLTSHHTNTFTRLFVYSR